MTPISINDPAVHVLKVIQRNHPTAIIAGGAPRDLFLELPIKDFDIFVPHDRKSASSSYWGDLFGLEQTQYNGWADIQAMAFFGHDNVIMRSSEDPEADSGYKHKQKIQFIWDLIINRVIYQIIVIDSTPPKQYVEDYFDFGICKAWCDGKQFHFSAPFMHDVQHMRLTLNQKTMTMAEMRYCMDHRKPRLLTKLPGYTFKVAPHLLDLYNRYHN